MCIDIFNVFNPRGCVNIQQTHARTLKNMKWADRKLEMFYHWKLPPLIWQILRDCLDSLELDPVQGKRLDDLLRSTLSLHSVILLWVV